MEAIKVQAPQPMQEDDDDGYRAALSEANVEVVAAVDGLAPRNFTTGAAPRRLMRELRSLGSDLPQPSCASTILVRYDFRKAGLYEELSLRAH